MRSARFVADRILADTCFLYTAFAPMVLFKHDRSEIRDAEKVLVKVGISSIPMQRLHQIQCGSPFHIEIAAFAPAGYRETARKIETRILRRFRAYKTRGEWLMLPNTPEMRKDFALDARGAIHDITGRPVEWRRVSRKELDHYTYVEKKAA